MSRLAELYPEYEWRNGTDMPESQLRVGRESAIGYVRELFWRTLDEARAAAAQA